MGSNKTSRRCPHCGKTFHVEDLSEQAKKIASLEEEVATLKSKLHGAPDSPKSPPQRDMASIWDKKPSSFWPVQTREKEGRTPFEGDRDKKEPSLVALGWATRLDRPEEKPWPKSPDPPDSEDLPKKGKTKKPEPETNLEPAAPPEPAPPPEATPIKDARRGPSVMDVLDTDPNLNQGQRETIRTIYQRFAPNVGRTADVSVMEGLTVLDVLDADPHLNDGQAETIRTVYSRFAPNPQ